MVRWRATFAIGTVAAIGLAAAAPVRAQAGAPAYVSEVQATGHSDEAIEHFRRAAALDPANAQAKANLETLEQKRK